MNIKAKNRWSLGIIKEYYNAQASSRLRIVIVD